MALCLIDFNLLLFFLPLRTCSTSAMSLLYECINTVLAGESVSCGLHLCVRIRFLAPCWVQIIFLLASHHFWQMSRFDDKAEIIISRSNRGFLLLFFLTRGFPCYRLFFLVILVVKEGRLWRFSWPFSQLDGLSNYLRHKIVIFHLLCYCTDLRV